MFILILMEFSKNKIIRCSENKVEPEVLHSSVQQIHSLQEFHTTRMESKNTHWLMITASSILQYSCLLNIELEHARHNFFFKQLELPNNFSFGMLYYYLS